MTDAQGIYMYVKDIKSMRAIASHFADTVEWDGTLNMHRYEFKDGSVLNIGETVINLPEQPE